MHSSKQAIGVEHCEVEVGSENDKFSEGGLTAEVATEVVRVASGGGNGGGDGGCGFLEAGWALWN